MSGHLASENMNYSSLSVHSVSENVKNLHFVYFYCILKISLVLLHHSPVNCYYLNSYLLEKILGHFHLLHFSLICF